MLDRTDCPGWKPAAGALIVALSATLCGAGSGTFLDRWSPGDLRVVSYNIFNDSIFPPANDPQNDTPARFSRVVQALEPDVIALQEIRDYTASETAALLNSIAPLPGGGSWHAHKHSDNVILSRHPFLLTTNSGGHADALIDLPDELYSRDLFVLNDHLPCCDREEDRQREAERIVQWLDDARTPGGAITLPQETPLVVLGDFNIVGSGAPLQTLLTGDPLPGGGASPPDWDGTPLTDAHPLHNGAGPDDYTWRNDSSPFAPGVLDYVLYSDSVLETANRFVLNTTTMSPGQLVATGLEANDVVIDVGDGRFDHLPLVVDFRLPAEPLTGDYNSDGAVDTLDYLLWTAQYGAAGALSADGNGDQSVDAADYTVWRDAQEAPTATAFNAPEPSGLLLLATSMTPLSRRRAGRRLSV